MTLLDSLRSDIETLAAQIDAPARYLPTYGHSDQSGRPHLEVTADGLMHWVVAERGHEFERRSSWLRDDILYWVFRAVTGEMASNYEVAHRRPKEDFRKLMFEKELELMGALRPTWRERRISDLGSLLDDAGVDLGPDAR